MGGLYLGFIGGAIAAGATTVGAMAIFFKNHSQNSLLNFKLDFFIGLLLAITAFSSPAWSIVFSFMVGILFSKASRLLIENFFMASIALNPAQQKTVYLLFLIVLKNIPEGMAAGATMSLTHAGLGNSLLTVIVLQNLIDGLAAAFCFLLLGLSPFLAMLGAMATGLVELFAGIFGGFMGHEIAELLPVIIAFSGGAMMSPTLESLLVKAKTESKKILVNPNFISGMVVTFIFIIWKELL